MNYAVLARRAKIVREVVATVEKRESAAGLVGGSTIEHPYPVSAQGFGEAYPKPEARLSHSQDENDPDYGWWQFRPNCRCLECRRVRANWMNADPVGEAEKRRHYRKTGEAEWGVNERPELDESAAP
jgi:hypothetical protein